MKDELVTLREVHDPVEAEMLVDLLAQEGIVASVPGNTSSAMLGGLAASALRVPLRVRASDAARAKAILSALDDYDDEDEDEDDEDEDDEDGANDAQEEGEDDEDDEDDEASEDRRAAGAAPPERKKTAVIAVAIILPLVLAAFGAGHFYARSYPRGFALLATAWTCMFLGCAGQSWAWLGLPLVVLADIFGAVAVIDARANESA